VAIVVSMSLMDLEELRDVAACAVLAGMDVVRNWGGRGDDLGARRIASPENPADAYVTAVDDAAENAVIGVLRNADPSTPVVGEVSGGDTRVERVWIVDPVDGTTNLVRGDSFVGVTVALLVNGQPVVGATGCPFTGELWSAVHGRGAHDRSGRRLELVERPRGRRRIALDPATSGPEHRAAWDTARTRLAGAFEKVELRSAIALELAYVAAGVFDGLVQIGGSPVQDFAAGVLLIREAGGLVTGLDGCVDVWLSDVVVAGTPQTHHDLCDVLLA
jgi:myo-inositol-1(or 4)-monophosphatase